jgi:two-component system sensor histidine kinase YesM
MGKEYFKFKYAGYLSMIFKEITGTVAFKIWRLFLLVVTLANIVFILCCVMLRDRTLKSVIESEREILRQNLLSLDYRLGSVEHVLETFEENFQTDAEPAAVLEKIGWSVGGNAVLFSSPAGVGGDNSRIRLVVLAKDIPAANGLIQINIGRDLPLNLRVSSLYNHSSNGYFYVSDEKNGNRYIAIEMSSERETFKMFSLIDERATLGSFSHFAVFAACFIVVTASLLFYCGLILCKTISEPASVLISAMEQYSFDFDDKDAGIDYPFRTLEFSRMGRAFNNMLKQIECLKVLIYEEKMEKKQEEFKRLQLQLNPHFFLNSLNIVFQLAQAKRFELIQEMTHCLVEYFRFMFQNNSDFVPLRAELQHTKNYLRIQELRFPDVLKCITHVDETLLEVPVPPLIIQTFVENAIKYAMQLGKITVIQIDITSIPIRKVKCISIRITDNGDGFPFSALDKYYRHPDIPEWSGEHIGIRNVRKRLVYLYGEQYHMAIGNEGKSGAYVDITFPA